MPRNPTTATDQIPTPWKNMFEVACSTELAQSICTCISLFCSCIHGLHRATCIQAGPTSNVLSHCTSVASLYSVFKTQYFDPIHHMQQGQPLYTLQQPMYVCSNQSTPRILSFSFICWYSVREIQPTATYSVCVCSHRGVSFFSLHKPRQLQPLHPGSGQIEGEGDE